MGLKKKYYNIKRNIVTNYKKMEIKVVCAGTINVGSYAMKHIFILAIKVEPHSKKIRKNYIRINNSIF